MRQYTKLRHESLIQEKQEILSNIDRIIKEIDNDAINQSRYNNNLEILNCHSDLLSQQRFKELLRARTLSSLTELAAKSNSIYPIVRDQEKNQLIFDASYWSELFDEIHNQTFHQLFLLSNKEMKQFKFHLETLLTQQKKFQFTNIYDVQNNLKILSNETPTGLKEMIQLIGEEFQRLVRKYRNNQEDNNFFHRIKKILTDKYKMIPCQDGTLPQILEEIIELKVLKQLSLESQQFWEKQTQIKPSIVRKISFILSKYQEQLSQMKVSLGFERQKLNPTKEKKVYVKEDITQFYRRQLHTICMGDTNINTTLLEEDQEYIISETQIMDLPLKIANVHFNSQKNQQWKTLQQLIDLSPDIIIGDFNIPNLLGEQRIISRKLTITKLLGAYKNIITGPTKGDLQIDYIFIKRTLLDNKTLTISDRSTVAINSDHLGLLVTLRLRKKIDTESLAYELKKKGKVQAELTKIVNLSYHSKEELVLDQLSKTQQLLQVFKSNSVSSLPYANPVGIQVWKKKIALLLWDTQLHHQIDAKQFIIDSSKDFGYNVSKETKQSSKLYQELTNHNAEELGRETQRISNQEQELHKFQQQIYNQFNSEYNKLLTYKKLIISEEASLEDQRIQTERIELQNNRQGFVFPKFIELPSAGINTSSICTIDRLNYINPTKATGRNQIPCSLFSILSKNIEMRQIMQQRIFNYYNNLLFSRNYENKIRATQYLIKKPQGNFFKLRGLEIPNIEQKVFGNCQTKLQKMTRQPYERYQFAYEQDTGTTKASQNFVNFILEEKQLNRDILILVLDAEGGFNRSDKIHSIQSMNKILQQNGYNLKIRETVSAAQIEEMSHPIGISRTKPNQNRIYQLHGVPQGSATSPETYCISLDEGIQNFHKKMREQNQKYLLMDNRVMEQNS